jgi:hypothetical protein
MREQLLFEGPASARKLSAFWTLLLLAAAIGRPASSPIPRRR